MGSGNFFNNFFNFRLLITLEIIKLLWAIGSLILLVIGFLVIFGINGYRNLTLFRVSSFNVLFGILIIVVGNLVWRLVCEYILILFNIHERLEELNNKK